jgi:hypothetical protein
LYNQVLSIDNNEAHSLQGIQKLRQVCDLEEILSQPMEDEED